MLKIYQPCRLSCTKYQRELGNTLTWLSPEVTQRSPSISTRWGGVAHTDNVSREKSFSTFVLAVGLATSLYIALIHYLDRPLPHGSIGQLVERHGAGTDAANCRKSTCRSTQICFIRNAVVFFLRENCISRRRFARIMLAS
jgi:hypothetical protein